MTVILIILAVLAIGLLGALIWLACCDGSMEVRRSRTIDADPEALYDRLRDFKTWCAWSPWLLHEPDCHLTYSENCDQVDGWHEWDGRLIGAGRLTHTAQERPGLIRARIAFTRPFKAVSEIEFTLKPAPGGKGCEVTWQMVGKMPFLMRFMTKRAVWATGREFDLGLAMLAGAMNPAAPHPRISFDGKVTRPSVSALATAFEGGIEDMQMAMKNGFPALFAELEASGMKADDAPFTAYHKVDPFKPWFAGDMCIPVSGSGDAHSTDGADSADTDTGTHTIKTLPGGHCFKVTLRGSYEFLELAWSAGMSHLRMQKTAPARGRPSCEVYENDPREVTDPNELITTLYIPISR